MVSCLGDPILLRRYALAEAKLAYQRMQNEKEGLIALANDLGLHPQRTGTLEDSFFRVHSGGAPHAQPQMEADEQGSLRGLSHRYRRGAEASPGGGGPGEGLKGPAFAGGREDLRDSGRNTWSRSEQQLEIIRARQKVDLGKVEEGAFPPCIKKMLSDGRQRHEPGPLGALCPGQLSLADQHDS